MLAVAWTLLIVAACSIPGRDVPRVDVVSADKLAHFVLFAGLGGLWMRAFTAPLRRRAKWVVIGGLAFALLTEVYQGLLPFDRSPDPLDALADVAGLLFSTAVYYRWKQKATV